MLGQQLYAKVPRKPNNRERRVFSVNALIQRGVRVGIGKTAMRAYLSQGGVNYALAAIEQQKKINAISETAGKNGCITAIRKLLLNGDVNGAQRALQQRMDLIATAEKIGVSLKMDVLGLISRGMFNLAGERVRSALAKRRVPLFGR